MPVTNEDGIDIVSNVGSAPLFAQETYHHLMIKLFVLAWLNL